MNKLCDWTFNDPLTGYRLQIAKIGKFLVLSVNERDYWFDEESGEFDGTGMMTTARPDCKGKD